MDVRKPLYLGVMATLLIAVTWSGEATALEKDGLSVSRTKPVAEADYSPIPTSAGGIFTDPDTCRTDATCDTIPIELDASGWPGQREFFLQLAFTLSWEAEDAEGTAVPDLDMYIYNDKDPPEEVGNGASSAQPERAGAEVKTRDRRTFYAVIVNFAGGPSAYHLKVEAQAFEIKDIPKFERPTARPEFTPLPTQAPAAVPLPLPTPAPPRETLTPVVTPGPDGPVGSVDLRAVEASAQVDDGGAPWWVILASVLGAAGVLAGTGLLLFRRVRTRRA